MKYLATVAIASALALAAGGALADPNNGDNNPPHHDTGGKGDQKGGPKGGQSGGQGGQSGQGGHGSQGAGQGAGQGGSQGSGGSHTSTVQGSGQGGGQGGNGHGNGGQGNGGQGVNGQNHFRGPAGQFGPQGGNGQGGAGRGGHAAPGFVPGNHALRPQDRGRAWFSVNLFPHNYHAARRFHYRPYNYPRGWYQQNWAYGQFLPYGWYDQQYYLDWNYFGLPNPPIGCEWVRVGNDALLVDVWSGEVLSVSSGLFW